MAETKASKKRKKKKSRGGVNATPNATCCAFDNGEISTDPRPSLENELEWCIRQLEIGLLRPAGKTSSGQKKEAELLIKKLSSTKTPIPRKRQLMHVNFGDYRQKMKEQPLASLPIVRTSVKPSLTAAHLEDEKTGLFYKKSTGNNYDSNQQFTFDFDVDASD